MPNRYYKLLEPTQIGTLTLKNGVVLAPMGANLVSPYGSTNKRLMK